ncbi:nebulin-related-anchoring protein-like isoform X3 [Carassius auratus]|uniref:Nebulin-related-anchoring protein-like isoform X3 n=1 Tax=Carassius auratus TaxID=7957 RepID=A0A6P6QG35_CARAU|nr:nebulin-related-anchoring protein-like isoform X3 [Carassius auratus]
MNVQKCARCGFVVYPAEKLNLIGQNWHKACFHCEVCKMVLTANNFVSHQKRPYCQVHNPKNNTFTSVYETPVNINAKKQSEAVSENKYREEGERFMSTFSYDMRSKEIEQARKASQLASQQGYQTEFVGQQSFYSGSVTSQEIVRVTQAQKTISDVEYKRGHEARVTQFTSVADTPEMLHAKTGVSLASDVKYTEEYEQSKGKGSFPAMITPGYEMAKKANTLASNVEYKKGHEERVSKYTAVADTPDVLLAKNQGKIVSDYVYAEEYEQQKGKGSFPAHFTPGYQVAKKAGEMASKVKYQQKYEQEIKGKASTDAGSAEFTLARENAEHFSQHAYTEEYEQQKGKGSFPAMITPGYQMAKKAHDIASDLKYKKDLNKMKGSSAYHTLNTDDNLTLNCARKINKLVSEVEYKKDLENTKGHSINYCETPQFKNVSKIAKFTSDNKYKENYTNHMKGHYEGGGIDKKTMHAMNVRKLASDIAYKSEYEQEKHVQSEYNYPATITPSYQSQKKLEPLKDKNYRQHIDKLKFSQVTDTPEIVQARINANQLSNLNYKANYEKTKTQYTLSQDTPELKKAKVNAELASDVKYKQEYEMTKGKMIGVKTVSDDSLMAHSTKATKLQSDLNYKKEYEDTKTKYSASLDMMNLTHAKKAQELATEKNYKTFLHEYTILPTDMTVEWAKKAYGLQSDKKYRSDLNWMKGVGWETTGSLDIQQARKATDLASEKKYRQDVSALKFTSVEDTPEMVQAKISSKLVLDRLYREKGENEMHKYTLIGDIPEHVQAKINAMNLSESHYKESWRKIRDGGYKLRLDAIPFQAAKSSSDILSDQKYKAQFEKTKGKMIGLRGLQDDINIAHSVHATNIQSDLKYKMDSSKVHSQFHLPMDMLDVLHAKKAQSLVSDQDYRLTLHKYTTLPDDLKVQAAKRAYELQSEKIYRSDLNYLRGAAWIATGALQIEGSKRATDLISEKKYRQLPYSFKHTSVTDSPDIVHAKTSNKITNERLYKEKGENFRHNYTITAERPEITQAKINAANFSDVKYKESWHTLRAQGYKLTMKDIPFQAAKASTSIASDVQYKHNHVLEKGKHIGARGVHEDSHLMHCLEMGRLQSDQHYRKDAASVSGQYQLPLDMVNLVHAKKAQALASDQDYKTHIHSYTALPDDIKVQWAKKAYDLQSQNVYKSDLNFMKGVAWDSVGAPQLESAKKAGELISDKKYRQHPDSLKFTQVADSPDIIHAKNSYMQCSERMYKSGDSDSMHKYTLPPDHPDFIRARINAQQISDKVYKKSGEQVMSAGYDLKLDAIPFQTAKASREIASDFRYKEEFVRGKGQQVGLLSVEDDPKIRHSLAVGKLQSDNEYKKQFQETRSQFKIHGDQPEFLHAKKSQAQLSNLNYRQHLHDYTCDPNQLNVKHAKQAYQLQSDVNYKSDLNWIKGVGWTPPGSHKAEMARRAAELGLAEGVTTDEAIAKYQQLRMLQRQQEFQEQEQSNTEQTETTKEFQQPGVNPDAMEILHVKRKKTIHTTFKQAKTTKSITSQSVASHSTTSQSITNQSTKKQSIMSQSHADESTASQMSENRAITDQAAAKSGTM